MRVGRWVRSVALATVASRLLGGLAARPALARPVHSGPSVSVVVPARNEAKRIAPLLAALRGAPGVHEVVVVDDGSTDGTVEIAVAGEARVIAASPPPVGWTGKTWALRQGLAAVATDWVVTLDADVIPDPELPLAAVERTIEDGLDLLTLAGRFELADPVARCVHAAMLTQLVYRFGPPGTGGRLANGQCMVARRDVLLGALDGVCGRLVEDVALARHLRTSGRRVAFLDANELMTVRPYDAAPDVLVGWGRSIGLRGIETVARQVVEIALLVATLVWPVLRVAARRADVVDGAALAVRLGTLVGTRRAYLGRGIGYWLSPVADGPALVAMIIGLLTPSPTWRGRTLAP